MVIFADNGMFMCRLCTAGICS